MRIVALGLGGAGCRIVDSLYAIDRLGSRVACVEGLVVDVDETTLRQLTGIPDSQKLYYPPFDPMSPGSPVQGSATATIDIAEIISRIHNFESGENDALFICCGLGGHMTDILPHIIAGLRSTLAEPIFGLVTLPCLSEGEKRSAKAADDIDILSPLLDGMIVFDNETWYKKTLPAAQARLVQKESGLARMLGFGKPEVELSPEMAMNLALNEAIVRRISLILKAGEFRADGGIDLAEVVLDSGEVLNTMKGGGFITIGYAVEHLTSSPLAFLSQLKPTGPFDEEGKKRASRIVELAKQAIYHEVSTPCDMTSAHKALILIAGPSHELSMQGFMTVRKWIDRSIRGLETRSGDYPVMNTKNVAIIVMLSGLENIPRISELREIREQFRGGAKPRSVSAGGLDISGDVRETTELIRDEMVVLPTTMQKISDRPGTETGRIPPSAKSTVVMPADDNTREPRKVPQGFPGVQPPLRPHTPSVSLKGSQQGNSGPGNETEPVRSLPKLRETMSSQGTPGTQPQGQQPFSLTRDTGQAPRSIPAAQSQEQARQRIEQELQRQRMVALSGTQGKPPERSTSLPGSQSAPVRTKRIVVSQPPTEILAQSRAPPRHDLADENPLERGKKTIVIRKRSPMPDIPESQQSDTPAELAENTPRPVGDKEQVLIKDQEYRAKDSIFDGKVVPGSSGPKVKDDSLVHTSLKPKKTAETDEKHEDESHSEQQRGKKLKKQDEFSWK